MNLYVPVKQTKYISCNSSLFSLNPLSLPLPLYISVILSLFLYFPNVPLSLSYTFTTILVLCVSRNNFSLNGQIICISVLFLPSWTHLIDSCWVLSVRNRTGRANIPTLQPRKHRFSLCTPSSVNSALHCP